MSIRVVIVNTNPQDQPGSMGQYAGVVAAAIAAFGDGEIETAPLSLALKRKTLRYFPGILRNRIHHSWIAAFGKYRANKMPADVYHILDGSHAYVSDLLPSRPTVTTVHDVIPALQESGSFGNIRPSRPGSFLIRKSLSALIRVDGIVADSKSTASDLSGLIPVRQNNVQVVYPSLAPQMIEAAQQSSPLTPAERRNSGKPFVLHVGHNGFYKNREGVLRIYADIREAVPIRLKMAGPKPTAEMKRAVKDLGIRDSVDFVTSPETEVLTELYRKASLFLFPSVYEGFGWPPLEAMLFGCPVVASNAGSLGEVLADAALSAEPSAEKDLARLAVEVLTNMDAAQALVRKGTMRASEFTPGQMGRDLVCLYRRVFAKKNGDADSCSADQVKSAVCP
jgi:glycosyltransferase involved in cell wall biosynthesis